MPVTTESPFLKVPDVAAELRVDRGTVYRMIHAGRLPHVKLGVGGERGSIIRVRADDLERFIADRETKSCPAP